MYITQDDGDIYVDISSSERIKLNADQATHIRKKISDTETLTIDYDDIKEIIDGYGEVSQGLISTNTRIDNLEPEIINLNDYNLAFKDQSIVNTEFCQRIIAAIEANKPIHLKGDCEIIHKGEPDTAPDIIAIANGYQILDNRYTLSFTGTMPWPDGTMYGTNGSLVVSKNNNFVTMLFEQTILNDSDIFYATYGETSAKEIENAYAAGKAIYAKTPETNDWPPLVLPLISGADSEEIFEEIFFAFSIGVNIVGCSISKATDEWSFGEIYSNHASAHAADGEDPITPEMIGAATEDYVDETINTLVENGQIGATTTDLEVLIPKQDIYFGYFSEDLLRHMLHPDILIKEDQELIITWNDVDYNINTGHTYYAGRLIFGNLNFIASHFENTGEPFCFEMLAPGVYGSDINIYTYNHSNVVEEYHNISITQINNINHAIDLKYLPEDVLTIDKLTSNGRSKYKTYTFNGSIENGMSIGDYSGIIRVSDDIPDFNNIKEISGIIMGQTITLTKEDITINNEGIGQVILAELNGESSIIAAVFNQDSWDIPMGLYFGYMTQNDTLIGWVSSMTFEENKTIGPEWMPGDGYGWTEPGEEPIVILPLQEFEITYQPGQNDDDWDGWFGNIHPYFLPEIQNGEEYTIIFNNKEEKYIGYIEDANFRVLYPINLAFDPSGPQPEGVLIFIQIFQNNELTGTLVVGDETLEGTNTLAIYKGGKDEVIHQIESKYLPTIKELESNARIGSEVIETLTLTPNKPLIDYTSNIKDLIGRTVTQEFPKEFYLLTDPKERHFHEYQIWMNTFSNTVGVSIGNIALPGLSVPIFGISNDIWSICPTFPINYTNYEAIIYVYKEIENALDLGITVQKGWYAVNSDTLEFTPFDIENNPIMISPSYFDTVDDDEKDYAEIIKENWFELTKTRTFTIKEENIWYLEDEDVNAFFICAADVSKINDFDSEAANPDPDFGLALGLVICVCLLTFGGEKDENGNVKNLTYNAYLTVNGEKNGKVDINEVVGIKTIDPKWLPEGLATETYVKEEIAKVDVSSQLADYALKSEIPSTEGFATETYVDNKVSALVNSAPEALNTLNELAAALGNDENFANTIMELIGQKAQVQIISWGAND